MSLKDHEKSLAENMPIGGGAKKVLYTLRTVQRMGVLNAKKALQSKNACKACAYGMGGQRGGMVNELDEFPSVCNKSVQAQSTDIQPPIPNEIFDHSLQDLKDLSGYEIEHLGRLGTPIYKSKTSETYKPVDWDWALGYAAQKFTQTDPARSFFYSSGRSSNEAGFLLQLFARLYGTNNINNCSYYCHQATSVGLSTTIGSGTATIELEDLTGCDLIFVIGANPSSNHPRFIHMLKACRERGGHVVIINPAKEPGLVRFAVPKSLKSMMSGGSWIASEYLQPKIGSDIALFKGIAKALFELKGEAQEFIEDYTSNFQAFYDDIHATDWADIIELCGVPKEDIYRVAHIYKDSQNTVFAWGMGMTHHIHGVENVEYIANLALLRGMVGKRFSGLLPLRGHSNVQGIGTIGVKPILSKDVFEKMEQEFGISLPTSSGYDTIASLKAADEGSIDAALFMGGNIFNASPDMAWTAQALDKIGFKVFLTTTLNKGHVNGMDDSESLVLPVTARDEEWQPTTQESMFNYVRLSDGGITRLAEVRPESMILCDIAKQVLVDCPVDFEVYKEHKHVRDAIARTVPGMEALADIDVAKKEFHIRNRVKHTPEFYTDNGKASFQVHPMPSVLAGSAKLPETKEKNTASFLLMTVRSEGQFNTIIYEEKDSYRKTEDRWSVLLNQDDIDVLGLTSDMKVNIKSKNGVMSSVTVYPFDLPRGNAMAYFPEANILSDIDIDPRSKTPAFKSIPVWIEVSQ